MATQLRTEWRKQGSHAEETKAVKAALIRAGFRVKRVGHGTGTAGAWLEIRLDEPYSEARRQESIRIAQRVTGRTGDYDGRILSDT